MQHHKNIQPQPPHENPEFYPGGRQGKSLICRIDAFSHFTNDLLITKFVLTGVIQRHNTGTNIVSPQLNKPTSPHPFPPGHEALSSLVDVAVRQPSLPVPQHKDEKQRLIIQEGLGERFSREPIPQDR